MESACVCSQCLYTHIAAGHTKTLYAPSSHKSLQRNFVIRSSCPNLQIWVSNYQTNAMNPFGMCVAASLRPQTPASLEWSFLSHITDYFILRLLIQRINFRLREETINIEQSDSANYSPRACVSAPKAFANSPPFSQAAQTSVYEPLKLFLKIISSYHNRLADSSLLFSITINEAAIVIFSSQIIHSHYTCRVKWMVFNKEEESPCMAAGLGNKVPSNTLLKHIAMLRERKPAIHHARRTSTLCCPTATVGPGVCTRTLFWAFCALWFTAVFIQNLVLIYRWSGTAINC